jgi:hypothetical protein
MGECRACAGINATATSVSSEPRDGLRRQAISRLEGPQTQFHKKVDELALVQAQECPPVVRSLDFTSRRDTQGASRPIHISPRESIVGTAYVVEASIPERD